MRFYKILFYLLLLCLVACRHNGTPDNLISEKQFVPLLVDIHLADGYLANGVQQADSLSRKGNGLYVAVFNKYHVDSVQFKKSFAYYSQNLEQMNRIYDSVVNRLQFKNDSVTKRNAAEEIKNAKRRTDSVARVFKIDSARNVKKQDSIKNAHKPSVKGAAKPIANHK